MEKPLKALIIEDNEDDAELLLRELKKGGYNPYYLLVDTKEGMLQALASEQWDVIFSDYSLPKFNGIAALEIYREKGLDIPFIILSGTIGEGTAVAAMKSGASDYLMKDNLARLVPAVERELREAEIRRQRQWAETVQSALFVISKAANVNMDLGDFFRLLHAIISELMVADNFFIALYDLELNIIEYPYFQDQYLRTPEPHEMGLGLVDYVLRNGKPVLFKQHQIQQLIEEGEVVPRSPLPQEWMGAILTGENGPLGVIAALNYQDEPVYSEKELAVLNFVADQAQLLIQRKKSEERVRQANLELSLAYDSTLEGWSRALEMRERETAGHSQRVVSLTLGLAKALGLSDEELVHIRRGALLHDIGKMGIPDHILLKPGKLTDDEWNIMRQHPIYAYQLLAPIQYLAPALDIPYAHHERWDGSGYPRGLKGEEIPLAARIFAVVDVWDALISDRPYSPAWTKTDAKEYIRSQAGKHFDPKIVEVFLKLIEENNF